MHSSNGYLHEISSRWMEIIVHRVLRKSGMFPARLHQNYTVHVGCCCRHHLACVEESATKALPVCRAGLDAALPRDDRPRRRLIPERGALNGLTFQAPHAHCSGRRSRSLEQECQRLCRSSRRSLHRRSARHPHHRRHSRNRPQLHRRNPRSQRSSSVRPCAVHCLRARRLSGCCGRPRPMWRPGSRS